VVHHPGWLADASGWQERTRRAEDRLSEALHARLIERFVERAGRGARRRGARSRGRGRRGAVAPVQSPAPSGPFSQLVALRDALAHTVPRTPVASDAWVDELVEAGHERFRADARGRVWLDGGAELARLTRGVDLLHPEVKLSLVRDVGAGGRQRIVRRLRAWARDLVDAVIGALHAAEPLAPSAQLRGLLYQLEHGLGTVSRRRAAAQLNALTAEDRRYLADRGVVLGRRHAYVSASLTAEAVASRLALRAAYDGSSVLGHEAANPEGEAPVSLRPRRGARADACLSVGYALLGSLALRVDVLERLAVELTALARSAPFALPPGLAARLDCDDVELGAIVRRLGYRAGPEGHVRRRRARRRHRRGRAGG